MCYLTTLLHLIISVLSIFHIPSTQPSFSLPTTQLSLLTILFLMLLCWAVFCFLVSLTFDSLFMLREYYIPPFFHPFTPLFLSANSMTVSSSTHNNHSPLPLSPFFHFPNTTWSVLQLPVCNPLHKCRMITFLSALPPKIVTLLFLFFITPHSAFPPKVN